ncbi:MAG: HIT domain-containing protein [Lentisphaerae bacterium]|nr:HIT domain-containing protein [Lentisphaerota bacterium]
MQRLWAPWRMDFLRAPKEEGCFLCRIVREGPQRDAENLVVCRHELGVLLLNRYPYVSGHLMAVPRRHAATLSELTEAERLALMELACLGERLLREVARPDGFNMGINQGEAAGAGLAGHLHWHVVPRWTGDTNFMPVLGGTRVISQGLEPMHQALTAALAAKRERDGGSNSTF